MESDAVLYQKMYLYLFNTVTDALARLEARETEQAKLLLIWAQQDCEELFISQGEETPS